MFASSRRTPATHEDAIINLSVSYLYKTLREQQFFGLLEFCAIHKRYFTKLSQETGGRCHLLCCLFHMFLHYYCPSKCTPIALYIHIQSTDINWRIGVSHAWCLVASDQFCKRYYNNNIDFRCLYYQGCAVEKFSNIDHVWKDTERPKETWKV